MNRLEVIPIHGVPEVRPGDEIAELIADAADGQGTPFLDHESTSRMPFPTSKAAFVMRAKISDQRDASAAAAVSQDQRWWSRIRLRSPGTCAVELDRSPRCGRDGSPVASEGPVLQLP